MQARWLFAQRVLSISKQETAPSRSHMIPSSSSSRYQLLHCDRTNGSKSVGNRHDITVIESLAGKHISRHESISSIKALYSSTISPPLSTFPSHHLANQHS